MAVTSNTPPVETRITTSPNSEDNSSSTLDHNNHALVSDDSNNLTLANSATEFWLPAERRTSSPESIYIFANTRPWIVNNTKTRFPTDCNGHLVPPARTTFGVWDPHNWNAPVGYFPTLQPLSRAGHLVAKAARAEANFTEAGLQALRHKVTRARAVKVLVEATEHRREEARERELGLWKCPTDELIFDRGFVEDIVRCAGVEMQGLEFDLAYCELVDSYK